MIRIKESKWRLFCDNAEKLGFRRLASSYASKYLPRIFVDRFNGTISMDIMLFGNRPSTETNWAASMKTLYTLIEQGYTEWIEEKKNET